MTLSSNWHQHRRDGLLRAWPRWFIGLHLEFLRLPVISLHRSLFLYRVRMGTTRWFCLVALMTVPFRICADGSCGWRNWPVAPRASRTRRCHRTIPFCLWSPASTGRTSPVCQSHLSVSPCFVFFCFFCTRYQFSAMLLGSLTIPIDQLPSLHC